MAVNRFDVKSDPVIQPFNLNTPEVSLIGIAANVDNSVYPASALIVAEVQGAGSFASESVIYETECKTIGIDWLTVGRGTTSSCRISSLDAGIHQVRMRAIPPFGDKSAWLKTKFEVFAADQPTKLTFTGDSSYEKWGFIRWGGAGQSWEIAITKANKNAAAVWSTTTTETNCWLDWLPTGNYTIGVRAKAGAFRSEWSYINCAIADLLPPENLTFTPDTSGATGGLVQWRSADPRAEMCEMELLNNRSDVLHTAITGSPQAIIPVLAPGGYSVLVRCIWRNYLSTWSNLTLNITDQVAAPTDLEFTVTGESAWLGELKWNSHGLPSDLLLVNTVTNKTELSITVLSGYYHVSLLSVGNYRFDVRTVGTWSKSDFVSTTLDVGQPESPTNLRYTETPDNAASAGRLDWQPSSSAGVSGYDVLINDSNGQTVISTRNTANWFDPGNIASGHFIAQVRAVSLLANAQSDWISAAFTVSPLNAPFNLTAVETLVESGTGFTSQVVLKWQSNDYRTQSYDAEYRLASSTAWSGLYSGPSTSAIRNGLTAGDYRFRLRAKSGAMESGFVEVSLTVRGIETAPADVTGLQISGITGQLAQLSWNRVTSVDVINGGSIHVRHTPLTGSAATWATAVPITDRLPGTTTLVTVPLLTGTYLVKAVNPADYWSVNAAAVVSNMSSLVGYNRVVERDEPDTWPGDKNKAVIDAGGSLTLTGGSKFLSVGNNDDAWIYSGPAIPVDTSKTYRAAFKVRQTENPESGGSRVFAGLATLDENYQHISGGAGTHRYFVVRGRSITTADGWQEFEGTIRDIGDNHHNFRNGTKYVRPMFIVNYKDGSGRAEVDYFRFYDESGRQLIANDDFTNGKSDWSANHSGQTVAENAPGDIVLNPEPPFYIMDEPLDLGGVFTVRLHLECDGTVYERDTIDDRTDNIDDWEMFDGAIAGGAALQFQVSTTDDDPNSSSAVWSDWTQFFVGDFRARAFRLRVALVNPTPSSAGTLAGLKLIADVPDRTETGFSIAVPAGGKTIAYKKPFLAPAVVGVTAQGMSGGDVNDITNNTASGFTIQFKNSAGAVVARTFDFAAVSYGEG